MAKQLANPVERHFEKGLAGLAALVLIGVAVRYVVTSPNQLDLGGVTVTPATIQAALGHKAVSVQQRLRDATSTVDVPEPLLGEFEESLAPLKGAALPEVVALGPQVPIVDAPGEHVGQAKLVEVLGLEKPRFTLGRSIVESEAKDGEIVVHTKEWVTVSSLFPVKEQSDRQRIDYGATKADVVFGPFDLQRRLRRPDGSWSDDDWNMIESWPSTKVGAPPIITLILEGDRSVVPKDDLKQFDEYVDDLDDETTQLRLLRPLMPSIVRGTKWTFPILTTYEDVQKQDDEYLNPHDPPSGDPEDRYGILEAEPESTSAKTLTKAMEHQKNLKDSETLRARAIRNRSENDAILAHNEAIKVARDNDASASDKAKAQRLMDEADRAYKDIVRWHRAHPGQQGGQQTGQSGAVRRERLPVQQVWIHDAGEASVASGETYQYRMRATILNRLAGQPAKFAEDKDAAIVFIHGPWSAPTDPVVIPANVEFFVTSVDEKREEIGVEMFQWFEGVWVKARRLKFPLGDRLANEARAPVPDWDDPQQSDNALVGFQADAVVIDVGFDRPQRERKDVGSTPGGVRFGALAETASVVLVGADGTLQERIIPTEKLHPGKRAASMRVWTPPR